MTGPPAKKAMQGFSAAAKEFLGEADATGESRTAGVHEPVEGDGSAAFIAPMANPTEDLTEVEVRAVGAGRAAFIAPMANPTDGGVLQDRGNVEAEANRRASMAMKCDVTRKKAQHRATEAAFRGLAALATTLEEDGKLEEAETVIRATLLVAYTVHGKDAQHPDIVCGVCAWLRRRRSVDSLETCKFSENLL
jgi:hypothetical protein